MNNTITIEVPNGLDVSDFYEHIAISAGYQSKIKKMDSGKVKVIDNPVSQEEFAKDVLRTSLVQSYRQGYKIKRAQQAAADADIELDEKFTSKAD